jgi:acyl carrier protein
LKFNRGGIKMTREEVFERLNKVFRQVFDDESIVVVDTTTADDIEDWDSLEHINLVVAVEKEFDVNFTMADLGSLKDVGAMVDLIIDHTK